MTDKITVFIRYPASIKLDEMPPVITDLIKDFLGDDGSLDWQFPNTREYNGYKIAGRVERRSFEHIKYLIDDSRIPFEIIGAQDFNYKKLVQEDGSINETGSVYIPLDKNAWHNFMIDINVGDINSPIYERPGIPEVGPTVVMGASPMTLT